jgi:glucosamine--fructose-6-phosphate aminotransferase (isomerizing)
MLLAGALLALELAERGGSPYAPLPEHCRRVLEASAERYAEEPALSARDHILVLGTGCAHGVAHEGALKLMEVSLAHAQAFHHLELRHGPISIVDAETLVVSLVTTDVAPHEPQLAAELAGYGAAVLRVGRAPGAPGIDVPQAPDGAAEALLCLPALQLLALRRAEVRAIDPDRPRNLDAVVRLAGDNHGGPSD